MKALSGRKVFLAADYLLMIITAFICLFPVLHILAVSLSSGSAATSGEVGLIPVDFTLDSYRYYITQPQFLHSAWVSVKRLLLAVPLSLFLAITSAYPLSKTADQFKGRGVYVWFFLITILFSGGLIPTYMVVKSLGLIDSIWALVLPGAVPVFNILLLLNFFRELPVEIEDAAFIDGAGPWRSLLSIYIPLSRPVIATVSLFTIVGHWNAWFDGMIYMNNMDNYPLQSFLQTVVVQSQLKIFSVHDISRLQSMSERTSKSALIFISIIPVLCIYPFLQKHFLKGLVMGSVKG